MAFSDYSTDPNANGSIAGINISEGCSPANVNNALRQLAADGKSLSMQIGGDADAMPKSGGTVIGDITRQNRGAYLHHASANATSGQVYVLPVGTPRPAAAEGVIVFYY